MAVILRDFRVTDRDEFTEMCKEFYSSPATLHELPPEHINTVFKNALTINPYSRSLIVEKDGRTAGYLVLSFTYCNEVAGMELLLEEIYIKPEFQGQGIGSRVFDWIFNEYEGKIKRYRLEVTKTNLDARRLYERIGFKVLDYVQMVCDVE